MYTRYTHTHTHFQLQTPDICCQYISSTTVTYRIPWSHVTLHAPPRTHIQVDARFVSHKHRLSQSSSFFEGLALCSGTPLTCLALPHIHKSSYFT